MEVKIEDFSPRHQHNGSQMNSLKKVVLVSLEILFMRIDCKEEGQMYIEL